MDKQTLDRIRKMYRVEAGEHHTMESRQVIQDVQGLIAAIEAAERENSRLSVVIEEHHKYQGPILAFGNKDNVCDVCRYSDPSYSTPTNEYLNSRGDIVRIAPTDYPKEADDGD